MAFSVTWLEARLIRAAARTGRNMSAVATGYVAYCAAMDLRETRDSANGVLVSSIILTWPTLSLDIALDSCSLPPPSP